MVGMQASQFGPPAPHSSGCETGSLPSYDDALAAILPHAPKLRVEKVALSGALGRVLAEGVEADRDQPPFDRSAVDGFAVRAAELERARKGNHWPIAGVIPAGARGETKSLPEGAVMRIATGAPLPAGADAVVMIEQSDAAADSVAFTLDKIDGWKNVHRRASDARADQPVLQRGTILAPQHLGIAATVGATTLAVTERPRITILSTGDEVVSPATPTAALEPSQIRNSNGPMLAALLASLGLGATGQPGDKNVTIWHEHLPDDFEVVHRATRESLSRSHLVLTAGGVSVGERDLLPISFKRLGLDTLLHGVAIQPGKPLLAMRDDCKLVLGLPGNPVSVLCCFHLFAWAMLRRMLGVAESGASPLPWRSVVLAEPAKSTAKRQLFRTAKLNADGTASVLPWQGSGDLMHTAGAQAWVRLPMTDSPIAAGTSVLMLPMIGV